MNREGVHVFSSDAALVQLARHSETVDQLAWKPAGEPDEEDTVTEEDASDSHLALDINPSQSGQGNQPTASAGVEPPLEVDEMQADSAASASEVLLCANTFRRSPAVHSRPRQTCR